MVKRMLSLSVPALLVLLWPALLDGRRVHVIERDLTEPHRMVGELLQPGGYLKLVDLGLEDCLEDIDAQRVVGYTLYKKNGEHIMLSYPLEKFQAADMSGRCFHNGRFVQKMREKAATLPNVRLEQGTVTSLIEEKGTVKGVNYKTKDGRELSAYAPLTIVCDGCFSNLRRSLCNLKMDIPSTYVGLILKDCQLPYANHGVLVMSDPSPVTFYPVSSTEVRCLVLIAGQNVPSIANGEMVNYLTNVVAPQVPSELRDALITAISEENNIRTMQFRSMPATCSTIPGSLLIGDAFNMRHPLSAGGMTVALSDIVVLRHLLKPLTDFNDANAVSKYLQRFYTLRKPLASTINILAGVTYQVFSPSLDPSRKEIREVFYGYLRVGGIFTNGAIGLLAGLNPRPLSLPFHFIAVAVYTFGRLLLPFPTPKGILRAATLLYVACGMIFPIIKAEGIKHMFFPAIFPA
ncbi:squalene monooxygenase SE1-like isoform X2 [Nicotiana tabacum]|uniref:Squalene monooxygenase SE1-like isoform X2 n=1 Tax=Nicotiana tabacum TaxID=4097 RepID=A0AC58U5Q4_TOBAC